MCATALSHRAVTGCYTAKLSSAHWKHRSCGKRKNTETLMRSKHNFLLKLWPSGILLIIKLCLITTVLTVLCAEFNCNVNVDRLVTTTTRKEGGYMVEVVPVRLHNWVDNVKTRNAVR